MNNQEKNISEKAKKVMVSIPILKEDFLLKKLYLDNIDVFINRINDITGYKFICENLKIDKDDSSDIDTYYLYLAVKGDHIINPEIVIELNNAIDVVKEQCTCPDFKKQNLENGWGSRIFIVDLTELNSDELNRTFKNFPMDK